MRPLLPTLLALVLTTPAVHAASLTLTDCAAPPVEKIGKRTVVDVPSDDVTIQCGLLPLPGTQRVEVVARAIVVDGDNGGSIAAGGKGLAVELRARGTGNDGSSITVAGANLTAANPNGDTTLAGPGAIVLRDSQLQAGAKVSIACTGAACPITLDDVAVTANDLSLVAEGDVTATSSTLRSFSPIDLIEVVSRTGNVVLADAAARARGVSRVACRDDVIALCPGPQCPLPVAIDSVQDAIDFCECPDDEPTDVETGIEGNVRIEAPLGDVDLRGASVIAGENLDVVALAEAQLDGATLRNCGPKTGKVTVSAASCRLEGAQVLDDEPDPAPSLLCAASGIAALGTCSARE